MSNAQKAQDFVTSFMKNLAEGVELTQSLQAVFAKILAEQVVVDADTNVVSFKPVFSTLLKVLTFIATPEADRPEAGSSYTQEAIDTAADSAATETGLTVGEEIPTEAPTEEPTDGPTDEPTDEPTDGPTDEPTEEPGVEGETFNLTAGADVIAPLAEGEEAVEGVEYSTNKNDLFVGAITSRSTTTTFDSNDIINGGAGTDTLKLSIDNKDFRGYSKDAVNLTNVERVELSNEGGRDRYFDAQHIQDVEEWVLNANDKATLELRKLADANIKVTINNQAESNLKLGFDTGAVSTGDELTLVLNNAGTAAVTDCDKPEAAKNVTLQSQGLGQLETLNITSLGAQTNRLMLDNTGKTTVNVDGSADINLVGGFNSQLKAFNAAEATGDVNANLTSVAGKNLANITGGTGDDTFSVTAEGISKTLKIDGGAGENTLSVTAGETLTTIKPTMENIQTLAVNGKDAQLTLAGENVTGLENVIYNAFGDAKVLLAGLNNDLLNVTLGGGSAGLLTYTGEGELIVSTKAGTGSTYDCNDKLVGVKVNNSNADVVASKADAITFNVEAYSNYAGDLTAGAAGEVTLNIASGLYNKANGASLENTEATEFAGNLYANQATTVNIEAEGKLGGLINASEAEELTLNVAAHKNEVTLEAAKGQVLTLTVEGDKTFDFSAASKLDGLQELTVTTSGTTGIKTSLNSLSNAVISGTGSFFVGSSLTAARGAIAEQTLVKATASIDVTSLLEVDFTSATDLEITGTGLTSDTTELKKLDGSGTAITAAAFATALATDLAASGITGVAVAVDTGNVLTITYTDENFVDFGLVVDSVTLAPTDLDTGLAEITAIEAAAKDAAADFTDAEVGEESDSVMVNAADLLGDFAVKVVGYEVNSKAVNGSVEIVGSEIGVNIIDISGRNDIEVKGGLGDDQITISGTSYVTTGTGAVDATAIAKAVITGGLGQDTFSVGTATTGKLFVEITDFEVGKEATSGDLLNFGSTAAGSSVAVTTDVLATYGVASNVDADAITKVKFQMQAAEVKAYEYNGNVYMMKDAILVELQGLATADYTAEAWV